MNSNLNHDFELQRSCSEFCNHVTHCNYFNQGETIKRDLDCNGLNVNMIYNRTLCHRLIYVANPT